MKTYSFWLLTSFYLLLHIGPPFLATTIHNPALPLNYKNIVLLENILDVSLEVAWLA